MSLEGSSAFDETSLKKLYEPMKDSINEFEFGSISSKDLQTTIVEKIKKLEEITGFVNQLGLFSSNELIEDVPTESMPFLLTPCFLGILHQNIITDAKDRLVEIEKSKVYYRSYLERLLDLSVIHNKLPWETDSDVVSTSQPKLSGEEKRKANIERFKRKRELRLNEESLKKQLEAANQDEQIIRELYFTQLQYWAERSFEELHSIEEELPLLKMMAERGKMPTQTEPVKPPPRVKGAFKPVVLARDKVQKEVFGLGYPAAPVLTVDEWYSQRFGNAPQQVSHANQPPPAPVSEDDDSEKEEEERQRAMRMDEFKDTTKKGSGNTHNKG